MSVCMSLRMIPTNVFPTLKTKPLSIREACIVKELNQQVHLQHSDVLIEEEHGADQVHEGQQHVLIQEVDHLAGI